MRADYDELPSGAAWVGISWGIVAGFVQWQLSKGYAVGSVNVRLATIKAYCQLANQAGAIGSEAYTQIKTVKGYGHKQAKKVDEKRDTTRKGGKKAASTSLTKEQADLLKRQPDTSQGRRDALLICLLLDHGLRCGEIAGLQIMAFDLKVGTFTFHRPKVEKVQTHRMTADTFRAATAYLGQDAPALGPVLLGSRKSGRLQGTMSERAINDRVGALGRAIGVEGLSPHDCRHYWATRAARQGTDPFALQEAGGWNSLAMPRRYVEAAAIANEGVKL
jgi:integrase